MLFLKGWKIRELQSANPIAFLNGTVDGSLFHWNDRTRMDQQDFYEADVKSFYEADVADVKSPTGSCAANSVAVKRAAVALTQGCTFYHLQTTFSMIGFLTLKTFTKSPHVRKVKCTPLP